MSQRRMTGAFLQLQGRDSCPCRRRTRACCGRTPESTMATKRIPVVLQHSSAVRPAIPRRPTVSAPEQAPLRWHLSAQTPWEWQAVRLPAQVAGRSCRRQPFRHHAGPASGIGHEEARQRGLAAALPARQGQLAHCALHHALGDQVGVQHPRQRLHAIHQPANCTDRFSDRCHSESAGSCDL